MLKYQRELRFPLGNPAHLPVAIGGIAHFKYFLERSNEDDMLRGKFALEMHRLKGKYPHREPDASIGKNGNMTKDGVALFMSEPGAKYGFTIRNTFPEELFPYLFYFDPEQYTIRLLYKPAGARVLAPLSHQNMLTIGMGSEAAFEFTLLPDEASNFGFLKLFVASEHIDLESLEQTLSPFHQDFNGTMRGIQVKVEESASHWDALTVILTMTTN